MTIPGRIGALLCMALAACAAQPPMTELAPTGKLRFGVAVAPEQSTFFVDKNATGEPRGVTVDLANDLARAMVSRWNS